MLRLEDVPERLRPYVVYYNGKPHSVLNNNLALKQKVTKFQLSQLKRLHAIRLDIYHLMELTEKPEALRQLFQLATNVEYCLQDNWNFPADIHMHPWFRVPRCTCPEIDNAEAQPYRQIFSESCPYHGEYGLIPYAENAPAWTRDSASGVQEILP